MLESLIQSKEHDEARQGEALLIQRKTTNAPSRKLYIESYGCQMNFADSEIVASILLDNGFETTGTFTDADVIFINTCSIRENAELRVRKRLTDFKTAKSLKPEMIIGVLGCMADRLKTKFLEEEHLVDLVVGPDAYRDLPNLLEETEDGSDAINVILSKEATGYGLINREGDNILEPVIDEIRYMGDDFFFAKDSKQYMLIKAMTNKAEIRYTSYHRIALENDVLLEYIHGRLRRVMKRDGILLDAMEMESVSKTGPSHYTVTFKDGRIGLLNDKGRWEVAPTKGVQALIPGDQGLSGALIDGKYGFVDQSGTLRIANRYENVGSFSEGLAPVKIGSQWGYIDANDHIAIQPRYSEVSTFRKGVAIVKKDGKATLIDKTGKELMSDYYDRISYVADSYYLTENNAMFGLANASGTEISIPKFDELRKEGPDKILIRRGGKYGLMKETGEYSLPIYYKNIIFDPGNQKILAEEEPIAAPILVEEETKRKNSRKGA